MKLDVSVYLKRPKGDGVWVSLPTSPAEWGEAMVGLDVRDSVNWDKTFITDFQPDIPIVKKYLVGKILDEDISSSSLDKLGEAIKEMYSLISNTEFSGNPNSSKELLDILYLVDEEQKQEAKLVYSKSDSIGIYQLKATADRDYRFANMEWIQKKGLPLRRDTYRLVYTTSTLPTDNLDSIFRMLNTNLPEDYRGRSLSVSDIIVVNKEGKLSAYYVDSFDFKEVPEFIEQAMEENEIQPEDIIRAFTKSKHGTEDMKIDQRRLIMNDAMNEVFELVDINGEKVLFTNLRIDRDTVPTGLFCYDVRESEGGSGVAVTIEPHVLVNHWGTILTRNEFKMNEDGYYELDDDLNYLGESYTIQEYQSLEFEENQIHSIKLTDI